VTIDTRLLERLEDKLGIGRRQVYNRIDERVNALLLPPEQAAIALALEHRVNVRGIATPEDMAEIRNAVRAKAPPVAPAAQEAPPTSRRKVPSRKLSGRNPTTARRRARTGKTVYVIHGRDDELRKSMFAFLRALKLEPMEFNRAVNRTIRAGGGGSPYVGDIVQGGLRDADAVIVLLSPDDVAKLKKHFLRQRDPPHERILTGQARANVLFEAGMALGVKPHVTILVQVGEVRPFSDVGGMHIVHLDDRPEARQELVGRLEATGLAVDTEGVDWYGVGTFEPS
jgi:predicted nucleotide-binding protein